MWTWCDVPTAAAATWIIHRCCGRQTSRLPPPCHPQLFWRWKRLICKEASAPGFGTWMAWRHLLISSGLCRFSGRQWTMVSLSLRWWACGNQSPPVVSRADFGCICCRGRHGQLTGAFFFYMWRSSRLLSRSFGVLSNFFKHGFLSYALKQYYTIKCIKMKCNSWHYSTFLGHMTKIKEVFSKLLLCWLCFWVRHNIKYECLRPTTWKQRRICANMTKDFINQIISPIISTNKSDLFIYIHIV